MEPLKIISVVGARPNFVKIAPFCQQIANYSSSIRHLLVHTGQHYDYKMSREFFDTLSIPEPDIFLSAGSGSHAEQTARIMTEFEKICLDHRPGWVMAVGDVNSALAATVTAKKLNIAVAHLEAGLRSFDMTMPEEVNRKVVDAIADLFFTPSADADANLIREGANPARIKLVGNIMIDTLAAELRTVEDRRDFAKWGVEPRKFVYVTLHRPSNVDEKETLSLLLETLAGIARQAAVIFPMHPRTMAKAETFGLMGRIQGAENLKIINPVSYHESISLAKNAALVITDSGGLQEETTFLGTPCLTVRPNTERPVTITAGTNKLTSISRLSVDAATALSAASPVRREPPPLWDGGTAARVAAVFAGLAG